MRNFKHILFIGCFIAFNSCSKNENVSESTTYVTLESRSASVANLPTQWLETFRLRILNENAVYSYSPSDAEYGIEAIFNILAAKGASQINNQRILKSEITLPLTNGALNQTAITSLSNQVYQSVRQYAFKTSPGLMLVDLNSQIIGNNVKFTISSYIGNLSNPIFNAGAGFDCIEDAFASSACFRSAFGDLDEGDELLIGGPCNSPNGLTSAQEQVQSAILKDIPRYVYGWKNQIVGKYVYTNSDCETVVDLWSGDINESLGKFANCTTLNLDYNDQQSDLSQIEYNSAELNCTVCALKEHFRSICPPGKVVCDVNLWGDL